MKRLGGVARQEGDVDIGAVRALESRPRPTFNGIFANKVRSGSGVHREIVGLRRSRFERLWRRKRRGSKVDRWNGLRALETLSREWGSEGTLVHHAVRALVLGSNVGVHLANRPTASTEGVLVEIVSVDIFEDIDLRGNVRIGTFGQE